MTNQQILEKAFKKALDNGWDNAMWQGIINKEHSHQWTEQHWDEWLVNGYYYGNIFDHDFAKALWGEEPADWMHGFSVPKNRKPIWAMWQHHLQQMVIVDDPIKYLGENL